MDIIIAVSKSIHIIAELCIYVLNVSVVVRVIPDYKIKGMRYFSLLIVRFVAYITDRHTLHFLGSIA